MPQMVALLPYVGSILVLWMLPAPTASAQPLVDPLPGPVIEEFGETYPVEAPDVATTTDQPYRLLFDISTAPDAPDALSTQFNTVARFLNMHTRAGVPQEQMHLAVVLHGTAGKYALSRAAYQERYGTEHTNWALMAALHDAGVEIYLCGQTAMHRGLPPDQLASEVQLALSAMTVIASLGAEGYTVVSW
jgi:intracellular sulfur oxidation DsrE/DsrF family protein